MSELLEKLFLQVLMEWQTYAVLYVLTEFAPELELSGEPGPSHLYSLRDPSLLFCRCLDALESGDGDAKCSGRF